MSNEALKRKKDFIKKQKGTRSDADIVAQRLVNIYRQLDVLGEEATQKYNQLLMHSISPEVLDSFRTIPGGNEVHSYYNFLTHADLSEEITSSKLDTAALSSLPPAEKLSPIWEAFNISSSMGGNHSDPIQMSVVNPIRASVVTNSVGGSNFVPASSTGSSIDYSLIENQIFNLFEEQKKAIMQTLSYIIIDSDIEKMHKNLKKAVTHVSEEFIDTEKDLTNLISKAKENAVFEKIEQKSNQPKETGTKEKTFNKNTRKFPNQKTKFFIETEDSSDNE